MGRLGCEEKEVVLSEDIVQSKGVTKVGVSSTRDIDVDAIIPDPSSALVTCRLISPRCISLSLFLKVHRQLPVSRNIFRCISTSQMSSSNPAPRPNTTANTKPSKTHRTKAPPTINRKWGRKSQTHPGKSTSSYRHLLPL